MEKQDDIKIIKNGKMNKLNQAMMNEFKNDFLLESEKQIQLMRRLYFLIGYMARHRYISLNPNPFLPAVIKKL
jgi:hypothetical protein